MNNPPSAVNPWKLQAAMPPDNSRSAGMLAAVGTSIGEGFRKYKHDQKTGELRDELISAMSPEEKAQASQALQISQKRDAEVQQADAKAQEARQIQTENQYKTMVIKTPEYQKAYLELAAHDPKAAAAVMDVFAQQNAQQNAELVAMAERGQALWGNMEAMNATEDPQQTRNHILRVAQAEQDAGRPPQKIMAALDMSPDERGAYFKSMKAMNGALLEIPDAKIALERQKFGLDVAEHQLDVRKQDFAEREAGKPERIGGDITNPSPKDFTVESIAKYQKSGNAGDLERYNSEATKRGNESISKAMVSAEALPNVNRALALVDEVSTGGIDSALLKSSQWLGIESANEAELNRNMKSAVLSQLKTIFGTQFTEKEGKLLADIEANFGKSNAGNKRILTQTKRILDMRVKRGLIRAEAQGDEDTINEIKAWRDMDLTPVDNSGDQELFSKYGIN